VAEPLLSAVTGLFVLVAVATGDPARAAGGDCMGEHAVIR
jgi:hypothetical protein